MTVDVSPEGNNRPLMTRAELAEYLQVPLSSLGKWGPEGGPPCVRLGKHMRYRWTDVQAWLESRVQQG